MLAANLKLARGCELPLLILFSSSGKVSLPPPCTIASGTSPSDKKCWQETTHTLGRSLRKDQSGREEDGYMELAL
jgi:hypothetical protein